MARVLQTRRDLSICVCPPVLDEPPPDMTQIADAIRGWHSDCANLEFAERTADDEYQWTLDAEGGFATDDVRRLGRRLAKILAPSDHLVIWLYEDPGPVHYKRLLRIELIGDQIETEEGREEGFEDQ
ncbi:MAG: hypothetical protein IPH44_38450 [Myxococcales bacterium]|nr:hypothetical protein [Myxococcales bacterium]MBK7197607.1 hypothetical protein [Myxococcales bacterium]